MYGITQYTHDTVLWGRNLAALDQFCAEQNAKLKPISSNQER